MKPVVSILVAAWNEAEYIQDFISDFINIMRQNEELIVVAGGTDKTYEKAKNMAGSNVYVLKQVKRGKNAALNKGLKYSNGEIIVLTDADSKFSREGLDKLLRPILNGEEDVTTGRVKPLKFLRENPFVLYQYAINYYVSSHYPKYLKGLQGANIGMRKKVLDAIGGFDEDIKTGTDYHLAKCLRREGFRIRFIKDCEVETEYPTRISDYIRRQSRWLRNTFFIGLKFGDRKEVKKNLMTFTVCSTMLLFPVLSLLVAQQLLYLWGVFAVGGIINRVRYVKFVEDFNKDINFKKVYPRLFVYMLLDFFSGFIAVIDSILPWRRRKW